MQALQAENQAILKEARAERDAIVKDAKENVFPNNLKVTIIIE